MRAQETNVFSPCMLSELCVSVVFLNLVPGSCFPGGALRVAA